MKGYDSKFLEELKNKNDLVDTVSRYVSLERRGDNFWGRCPFHHEKTPSFTVNGKGQFYYCFGCHKSGDVINFIMEMESMDFGDAVKFLADRVQMKLPEIKYDDDKIKEQKQKKERLLSLLKDAAKYYASNFRSGKAKEHVLYAEKRRLTPDTLSKFGIGASLDYDGVIDELTKKGYQKEEIYESGVAGKNEKNGQVRYYDALAGRLIIPVIDQFGNVIAFCGRIIEKKENVGKYVNTRETFVFSKGKTLFNLNNLKKVKNEKGIDGVIIVEGHMDVISLVQAGVENVVASMGTALTKDQARIIKRYTDKVFISYDGDFAGQKASIRGLEILNDEGLEVKVVSLPEGLDPDDVIKNYSVDKYYSLVKDAMPLIDFKLDVLKKTFDINTVDGKRKYISSAVKVIKESPSPAEQEDLLKTVRDLTGVTFDALKRELYAVKDVEKVTTESLPKTVLESGSKVEAASRFVLYSLLFGKSYSKDVNVKDLEFMLPVHKFIQNYLIERIDKGEEIRFSDLYQFTGDEYKDELSLIAGIETEEGRNYNEETYFFDCIKALKLDAFNRELSYLNSVFSKETDVEKRKEIVQKISEIIKKRDRILK